MCINLMILLVRILSGIVFALFTTRYLFSNTTTWSVAIIFLATSWGSIAASVLVTWPISIGAALISESTAAGIKLFGNGGRRIFLFSLSTFVSTITASVAIGIAADAVGISAGVTVAIITASVLFAAQLTHSRLAVRYGTGKILFVSNALGAVHTFFIGAPSVVTSTILIFIETLVIRIAATMRYINRGFCTLPRNFRRLVLCTSPRQLPELIPGLKAGDTRIFTLTDSLAVVGPVLRQRHAQAGLAAAMYTMIVVRLLIWFLPGWLYRITLKSTAWFWWPLAFLGKEPRRALEPALFHRQTIKSIWGIGSIVLSLTTILIFLITNFVFTGAVFRKNPLLIVLGYAFVVDWSMPPWQLSMVAAAFLSLAIVVLLNYVNIEYEYAQKEGRKDLLYRTQRKFVWIEVVARIRLILTAIFWLTVGGHTLLYFNSLKCWFAVPLVIDSHARTLYGDRMPQANCEQRVPWL
jgi:hypothetical protein